MIRKLLFSLILATLLLTPSPVLAAGGLLDAIKTALAPLVAILDDYAAIATGDDYESAWTMGGVDWKSTETTDQALQQLTAPAEYYAEAPTELRNAGYTLEQIRTANPDSMAARDFASWLGGFIAVPFLYVRGFKQIGGLSGPLGLLIDWVLMMAVWVTFVRFIEFLFSIAGNVASIGEKIIHVVGLLKP